MARHGRVAATMVLALAVRAWGAPLAVLAPPQHNAPSFPVGLPMSGAPWHPLRHESHQSVDDGGAPREELGLERARRAETPVAASKERQGQEGAVDLTVNVFLLPEVLNDLFFRVVYLRYVCHAWPVHGCICTPRCLLQ